MRGDFLECSAGSVLLRFFLAVACALAHDCSRHAHAERELLGVVGAGLGDELIRDALPVLAEDNLLQDGLVVLEDGTVLGVLELAA